MNLLRYLSFSFLISAAGLQTASAGLTLNFGINSIVGKSSTGGDLIGYSIRIGKFQTITPTFANYGLWNSDFVDLTGITTGVLVLDGNAFVSPPAGEFGPLAASGDSSEFFSSMPSGFSGSDQISAWIFNPGQTQAVLVTSSTWILPASITVSPDSKTFGWINGEGLPTAVGGLSIVGGVGQIANNAYQDAFLEKGVRIVTSAVPEPTSAILLGLGFAAVFARRRSRA